MDQQKIEWEMCKMAQAVDYMDEGYLVNKVAKIFDSIRAGSANPQILWAIHDYAQGCLEQLRFFRSRPEIPMPTPYECESFVPWKDQQLMAPGELHRKEKRLEKQTQKAARRV